MKRSSELSNQGHQLLGVDEAELEGAEFHGDPGLEQRGLPLFRRERALPIDERAVA
jgi:hypothetical protein